MIKRLTNKLGSFINIIRNPYKVYVRGESKISEIMEMLSTHGRLMMVDGPIAITVDDVDSLIFEEY